MNIVARCLNFFSAALISASAVAESPPYEGPVIDMHLHAYHASGNGPPGMALCPGVGEFLWDGKSPWAEHMVREVLNADCPNPMKGSLTDEALRDETIAIMRELRVRGLLGGPADRVADWMAKGEDVFWPARHLNPARDPEITPQALQTEFAAGEIVAISEITSQYSNIMVDDPRMAPFWEMAEREGVPVGVHIGPGPPGTTQLYPDYRPQNPNRLAEVLAKYPKLRLFVMHAGYPFVDDVKALLYSYPQLMVEVGVLQFGIPRAEYHAFMEDLTRAGFADRIMFGSDQMNWPDAIKVGIDAVNEAPYLSSEQKKMILHDNAARFLRLDENGIPGR